MNRRVYYLLYYHVSGSMLEFPTKKCMVLNKTVVLSFN